MRSLRACLLPLLALLAGCGTAGGPATPAASAAKQVAPSATPSAAATPPAASQEITLELVDHEALTARIAAGMGRVVVLDCWSTSCPPCIKEFPGLLALQKRFGDDVLCLSLSLDYEGIGTPDDVMPRVRGFLEDVGATIPNMLSSEESDVMLTKLDLVSVPGIFVYAADGALAKRFDDDMASTELGRAFTYADVEAEVRRLLGQ